MDEQKELQELSPQPDCGGCDGCAGCGGCEAEPVHETVEDALAAELLPMPAADAAEDAEPLPEQVTVVDVRFRTGSKVYYFDPGDLTPKMGDHVIIDTARGPEFGFCAGGCHTVPAADVVTPLRPVLRMATPHDEKIAADNYEKEKKAFSICLQKIEEHKLDMQLVSAECAFDGSKILFFFTADYTNMPASVMEQIRLLDTDVTVDLRWNGQRLLITPATAQQKTALKAYWTFEQLCELYAQAQFESM